MIEDAASGQQLWQTLASESPSGVARPLKQKPEGDKKSRLSGVSAMIEAGQLILPERAPWLAEFKAELLGFPNARYDDQVDALSQLLTWVRKRHMYIDDLSIGGEIYSPGGWSENDPNRPSAANDWYNLHGDLDDDFDEDEFDPRY